VLVRFYAVGREIAGVDEAHFDVTSFQSLATSLRAQFGERMARLAEASTLLLDGTRHRITDDVELADGDVVDLLPPFAGG
jgi:molybdopterin converting factor small subunit